MTISVFVNPNLVNIETSLVDIWVYTLLETVYIQKIVYFSCGRDMCAQSWAHGIYFEICNPKTTRFWITFRELYQYYTQAAEK